MGKADVEPASQTACLAEGQRSKEKTLQIQVSHRDGEEGEGGQDNTRWGVGEPLRGGASRLRQDGKEPRAAAGRSLQASVGCLGSRQEEERSRDSAPDAAPGETLQGFKLGPVRSDLFPNGSRRGWAARVWTAWGGPEAGGRARHFRGRRPGSQFSLCLGPVPSCSEPVSLLMTRASSASLGTCQC